MEHQARPRFEVSFDLALRTVFAIQFVVVVVFLHQHLRYSSQSPPLPYNYLRCLFFSQLGVLVTVLTLKLRAGVPEVTPLIEFRGYHDICVLLHYPSALYVLTFFGDLCALFALLFSTAVTKRLWTSGASVSANRFGYIVNSYLLILSAATFATCIANNTMVKMHAHTLPIILSCWVWPLIFIAGWLESPQERRYFKVTMWIAVFVTVCLLKDMLIGIALFHPHITLFIDPAVDYVWLLQFLISGCCLYRAQSKGAEFAQLPILVSHAKARPPSDDLESS